MIILLWFSKARDMSLIFELIQKKCKTPNIKVVWAFLHDLRWFWVQLRSPFIRFLKLSISSWLAFLYVDYSTKLGPRAQKHPLTTPSASRFRQLQPIFSFLEGKFRSISSTSNHLALLLHIPKITWFHLCSKIAVARHEFGIEGASGVH